MVSVMLHNVYKLENKNTNVNVLGLKMVEIVQ